jgi:hypothetical protein
MTKTKISGRDKGWKMELTLIDCEKTLLRDIADHRCRRKHIAQLYRLALMQDDEKINWKVVNNAIIKRWSIAGLEYIKQLAWSNKNF